MNVVYVGDVVKGIILAAEKGRTGERYILGGANMTTREVFARTAELIGGRAPIARAPLPILRGSRERSRLFTAWQAKSPRSPWT